MIINFKTRGISQDALKLAQIPTLIKKKYSPLFMNI